MGENPKRPFRVPALAVALAALGACAQAPAGVAPPLAEIRARGAAVTLAGEGDPPGAIRADEVIGAPLRAADGSALGRVSDLVIGPGGRIEAVVLSGGAARVPWGAVRPAPDGRGLALAPGAAPSGGPPPPDPAGSWRAAALLDGMVSLRDGQPHGIVSDLVFDPAGTLRRVVVTPSTASGLLYPIDHPFRGAGADRVPGLAAAGPGY
jgi:hypothetical protein